MSKLKKKPHWTQTPEGKKKQKLRYEKSKLKQEPIQIENTPIAVNTQEVAKCPTPWSYSLDGLIEEKRKLQFELERLEKQIKHRIIELE